MHAVVTNITGIYTDSAFDITLTFVGVGESQVEAIDDAFEQARERFPHARTFDVHNRAAFEFANERELVAA